MLNLKKTALAVIALGSTAAFAGTMGPVCSAVNVTVPCENTAWDIGGRALYMQATGGFVGESLYQYNFFNRTTNTANSVINTEANPQWGWGFQLEGSYHYSTGNDFNVNWYHYRSGGTTRTLNTSYVNYFFSGTTPYGYPSILPGTSFSNTPSWDQVNMEFGQHVDFGENKFARLHAGMNFSRVAFTGTNVLYYNIPTGTTTSTDYSNVYNYATVFNGFGPRVGTDLNYEWGNGLSVYGTGALSVLAGTNKYSREFVQYNTTGTNIGQPATGFSGSSSTARVIGELDAKLGFMYTYAMAQGDLSLDVGWAFAQYIGALRTNYHDAVINTNASQTYSRGDSTDNFGIQGLYFGLKWIGNVA